MLESNISVANALSIRPLSGLQWCYRVDGNTHQEEMLRNFEKEIQLLMMEKQKEEEDKQRAM